MKKHSVKNERINAEMQRELSRILREEVKDPRIPVMISVTDAQVAPDLKTCKAYISVLGDDETVEETKAALKSAAGFIRHEVAVNLNLRLTPEITFIRIIRSPTARKCRRRSTRSWRRRTPRSPRWAKQFLPFRRTKTSYEQHDRCPGA